MSHYPPTLTMRWEWMPASKRWRVTWTLKDPGRSTPFVHWVMVDVQEPITVLEAHRLADAIKREMESWLPLYSMPGGSVGADNSGMPR